MSCWNLECTDTYGGLAHDGGRGGLLVCCFSPRLVCLRTVWDRIASGRHTIETLRSWRGVKVSLIDQGKLLMARSSLSFDMDF